MFNINSYIFNILGGGINCFGVVRVAYLFICVFLCVLSYYVSEFRIVMSVVVPHGNGVRFIFTTSCL